MAAMSHDPIARPKRKPMPIPNRRLVRLLPVLVIVIVAISGAVLIRDRLSFAALAEHRDALIAFRDANYWQSVAVFMVAYLALVSFSLPGATLSTMTGGFLFSIWPGVAFNVIAAGTGACLLFLSVRTGLGEGLARRMEDASGAVERVKRAIDRNQWPMLFLIRLVPALPFFVANILPALLAVPFRRFALSTYLGILPAALVYTSIGAGLGDVFDRGENPDPKVIFEAPVLLPLLGLAALVLLPAILRAIRGDRT